MDEKKLHYFLDFFSPLEIIKKIHTVRKMGLILRSIEWVLKMQFSMARKFTLQPLRRYDVKPPKKTHKRNLPLDMPCHEKTK